MFWVEYSRGWFLSKEAYGLTTLMAVVLGGDFKSTDCGLGDFLM